MIEKGDGLFIPPLTEIDWVIMSLAVCGYLFRMYLMYSSKDDRMPKVRDWLGIGLLTILSTITLYEMMLQRKWNIKNLYFVFAFFIVAAKDITDWLFISLEGRNFLIGTLKQIINKLLHSLGYTKDEEKNENE